MFNWGSHSFGSSPYFSVGWVLPPSDFHLRLLPHLWSLHPQINNSIQTIQLLDFFVSLFRSSIFFVCAISVAFLNTCTFCILFVNYISFLSPHNTALSCLIALACTGLAYFIVRNLFPTFTCLSPLDFIILFACMFVCLFS